jgi:cytochrome c oxidase subunit 2
MYIVAALLMALAAVVVVILMFVPADAFERRDAAAVWVPGSTPGWTRATGAAEFDNPGLTELAPGRWLLILEASNWTFRPSEVRIPAGTTLSIRARSKEEYHGFALVGTDVNISLELNAIKEATHTFDQRGEYQFVCSVYCGSGHTAMIGKVVVY